MLNWHNIQLGNRAYFYHSWDIFALVIHPDITFCLSITVTISALTVGGCGKTQPQSKRNAISVFWNNMLRMIWQPKSLSKADSKLTLRDEPGHDARYQEITYRESLEYSLGKEQVDDAFDTDQRTKLKRVSLRVNYYKRISIPASASSLLLELRQILMPVYILI